MRRSSYGPRKRLYNRFVRWAAKGVWLEIFHALAAAGGPPAEVLIDSSAVKAHAAPRAEKGGTQSADRRSRGGRTTKIHALTDACCRPVAFLLTGGHVADCIARDELLDRLVTAEILYGDKGYDSNAVRRKIESKGAAPNIPPQTTRHWKNCFSPWLYHHRNAIERIFGRLKDFRRIATRYDRLARNFLAAVCLAATGYESGPSPFGGRICRHPDP
jgi:transposase